MSNLLRLARSSLGGMLVGWVFAHLSFAIPLQRLRETGTLVAFHHPKPNYPLHILIVPKKTISSLTSLTEADSGFLDDVFQTTRSLVSEWGLEKTGYRLIVNGGEYQDVAQLHFHLIAEKSPHLVEGKVAK